MLLQTQDAVHWRVRRTASDPSSQTRQDKRGLRLSHLSWIVIAAAAVAGEVAIQFSHHDQMEQFAAPVVNVPAFHVIGAADVRPLWRPASQIPRNAIRSANGVIGHVAMAGLAANQPITSSELGPDGRAARAPCPWSACQRRRLWLSMASCRRARRLRRSPPARCARLATPKF